MRKTLVFVLAAIIGLRILVAPSGSLTAEDAGVPPREPTSSSERSQPLAQRETASKYLLLDSRLIEKASGVHLVLGEVCKEPRNPLMVEDKPWEVRFDNLYANVCYDPDERVFKCWYSPFILDPATSGTPDLERKKTTYRQALGRSPQREMGVCYAVSRDGLAWQKPELGIVEFGGSSCNNLVMRKVHGAGVHMDPHETDPARRYKMFFNDEKMAVAFSSDGLHWSAPVPCPEINAVGDTHNNAFWDCRSSRFVGFTRLWSGRERIVGRTQSEDFLHWTKAQEVLRGENPVRQTYAMPVFPYANVYLGLVMVFNRQTDLVDCELAWSPDTIRWNRVCPGTSLIPRGPANSCDSGCIYAAAYPVALDGQLLLYYGGSDGPHTNWRKGSLCLARLPKDGFAGMEPSNKGQAGVITTKALRCQAARLHLSADAARGSVHVALLDPRGKLLKRSRPVTANAADVPVVWEDGTDLGPWLGQPVVLQFELDRARLYAFAFSQPSGRP